MILATLWVNPMQLPTAGQLWFAIPLCLAVALVYKTVRTESLRAIPWQTAKLTAYLLGAMALLTAGIWGAQAIFL